LDGQTLRERLDVLTEPGGEVASIDSTGSQIQHDVLLIVKSGLNVHAVQDEKRRHGGVADALVAVYV